MKSIEESCPPRLFFYYDRKEFEQGKVRRSPSLGLIGREVFPTISARRPGPVAFISGLNQKDNSYKNIQSFASENLGAVSSCGALYGAQGCKGALELVKDLVNHGWRSGSWQVSPSHGSPGILAWQTGYLIIILDLATSGLELPRNPVVFIARTTFTES